MSYSYSAEEIDKCDMCEATDQLLRYKAKDDNGEHDAVICEKCLKIMMSMVTPDLDTWKSES